jgi:hypothetical protein
MRRPPVFKNAVEALRKQYEMELMLEPSKAQAEE